MRAIFLADAHLRVPTDKNYQILLQFLQEITGNTDTLFIMGDLFDFWIGFPSQPHDDYQPVLNALRALVASGCRLIYFEGNHDFFLGDIFSHELKAEIYSAPHIMTIQGKRLYLCHGDQMNSRDYSYRLLRAILRNSLTASLVKIFPPALAYRLRNRLQCSSRSGYHHRAVRWDYGEIVRSFSRKQCKHGVEGVITGHFHIPFLDRLDSGACTVISLGDWMESFTYAEMVGGKLTLRSYTPTETAPDPPTTSFSG